MAASNVLEMLDEKIGEFDNTDEVWVRFIRDHKKYIINNSTRVLLSDSDRSMYEYRLDRYLSNVYALARDMHWIIAFINDIDGGMDFHDRQYIYIISRSFIDSLYQSYQTTEGNTD